jgi:hypothetical protein
MALARQLSPERGGSSTDLRFAQMSLDEALEEPSGEAIASLVLSERARRINKIAASDKQRLTAGLADAKESAKASQLMAAEAQNVGLHQEQQIKDLTGEKEQLAADLRWSNTRTKRISTSVAVVLIATFLFLSSFWFASSLTVVVLGGGLAVLAFGFYRWSTERESKLWPIVVGGVIDLIGVVSGLVQIFGSK